MPSDERPGWEGERGEDESTLNDPHEQSGGVGNLALLLQVL